LQVQSKKYTFTKEQIPFTTESGHTFKSVTTVYETYGVLNSSKNNAVLVLHALSGDAHAAGYHSTEDRKPGWWDEMIGPGKAIDTNKYYVLSSNVLGGCRGTTGPCSINPSTGKPFGSQFPEITIHDMVRLQKLLVNHLGISKLKAVIGGSMGGMQALEWAVTYPDMVENAVVIAATDRLSPLAIAFNYMGINAICNDPNYRHGDYYGLPGPEQGFSLARMIGIITYKSDALFNQRFSRDIDDANGNFKVENYLRHHGKTYPQYFDANTYVLFCKAMSKHDIYEPYGSQQEALQRIRARVLMVGIDSDMLFFPRDMENFIRKLNTVGGFGKYEEIHSSQGHDSFLIDYDQLSPIVSGFLETSNVRNAEEDSNDFA
jgi:homoserine O-acetyltransferase